VTRRPSNLDPTDWTQPVLDLDHLAERRDHLRALVWPTGRAAGSSPRPVTGEESEELTELEHVNRLLQGALDARRPDESDLYDPELVWEGHFVEFIKGRQSGSFELDAWPHRYIDWGSAAKHLLDSEWHMVRVHGRTWWARPL
jgi:hypothetical protein